MADSTQGDTGIQDLDLLVAALIALIAGLVIHSFIIGVNVTDWWKGRSVTPVDHIVTSLGVSRMCAQCVNTPFLFMAILPLISPDSYESLSIIGSVYDVFIYANFCLTSLLSIVFCLKISNFHTRLFLYLKRMIAHRTVYFIVAAVLLSALNSCILFMLSITDMTSSVTYNRTITNLSMDCTSITYIYNYTAVASFPLLFSCISSVVLFTSLYHHTTKMKLSSNLSINLETYYSMMKYVSFTFIYNTGYFIGHFLGVFYYFFYCIDLPWLRIVLDFLPVLHSSFLIYRTAKLRSQMSKALQTMIDFFFQRKCTETGENIEVVAQ